MLVAKAALMMASASDRTNALAEFRTLHPIVDGTPPTEVMRAARTGGSLPGWDLRVQGRRGP